MGTEREIDALASEAIAASEKEFFDEAMGREESVLDETGDRSLEQMGKGLEGQHEADDDDGDQDEAAARAPEAKANDEREQGKDGEDGKDGRERDPTTGQFKPKGDGAQQQSETTAERGLRKELTGERDKRKSVETEFAVYRSDMEKRFATLEGRLQQLQQPPQPKAQEKPKDDAPDRWTDPDKYDHWYREQIRKDLQAESERRDQQRVAHSFEDARAKHGDSFNEAFKAADALPADNPATKQLLDMIRSSANPGERLVTWHRQQQAMREIGNDPSAYRERLTAETRESLMKDPEFRKQVIEAIRGEAGGAQDNGSSPRTATKLPPSLSDRGRSAGRAPGTGAMSDAELFDDVMR